MAILNNPKKNNSTSAVISNTNTMPTGNDVIGQQIISTGTITLGAATSTPTIPNEIPSYNGLGISALHGTLTVVDTPGGTAPTSPTSIQSVIKQFSFQSVNGAVGEPIFNFDGSLNEITNWQRIVNPNGNYQTSAAPTISTSPVTTTWNFDIYYSIPKRLLPVRPTLVLNTEGSRASTLNGMSSTANLTITADYTSSDAYGNPLTFGSRLKNIPINISATGVQQFSTSLDTNVSVYQQAYDVGADSNLSSTQTINFSLGGQQILQNTPYQNIIGGEANLYPLGTHISGFFPFRVMDKKTREFNSTLNESFNFANTPTVGTGVNQLTNKMMAYLQEII